MAKPKPPKRPETTNLEESNEKKYADLNFKVSEEFKHSFRIQAAVEGIKMKELLIKCFNFYKESKK